MGKDSKYVIVTERDCQDWLDSHGPIVMEQYMHLPSYMVLERARQLEASGRYGQVLVCKLVPVGGADDFEALLIQGSDDG